MRNFLLFFVFTFLAFNIFAQQSTKEKPISLRLELSKNVPTFSLEVLNVEQLLAEDQGNGKNGAIERTALIRSTDLNLYNSGVWTELENGDRVWRLAIHSKEAFATTLLYKNSYIPEGGKLFVYNTDYTQTLGAFTSANNHDSKEFSTELIHGDKCVVEYFEPANQAFKGSFTIEGIAHLYKQLPSDMTSQGFADADPCQVNVNCSEGNAWQDIKKGVARIFVIAGGGGAWCTGSLVNNTNLDCKPYFLTAYHCGEGASANEINQWTFYFNYEASACTSPNSEFTVTNGNPNYFTVSGCSVVSGSNDGGDNSSDFLLLEFNNNISASEDVYYNGWDRTLLNTVTTNGVSIHHPAGDIKKISTYTSNLTTTGWNNSGLNSHYRVFWASTTNGHGVTEGGSSGSPIFNAQGLIIGTLTGGSSFCVTPGAPDSYGKVSYHWNSNGTASNRRLDIHLDPAGSGAATSMTGSSSPCTATNAVDAGILSITEPNANTCGASITPVVVLRNFGTNNLTTCQIQYQLSGGAMQTFNWSGNLSTNANVTITLPSVNATNGNNTFTAFTQNPNNTVDGNTSNDAQSVTFTASAGVALPLVQTFQNTTFPPTDYSISNGDNDVTWARTTAAGFNSTASMFLDNWDYNAVGAYDWLVMPPVDLSNASSANLTYDYAYAYFDGNQGVFYDSLAVAYSLDCGASWFALSFEGGIQLATAGGQSTEFTPTPNDWENVTLDLTGTALMGESNVTIAFVAVNGYGNNLYVDNINFQSSSSTQTPIADFTFSNPNICTGGTVAFTNTSTKNPGSFVWSFPGGAPSSSTQVNPSVVYANPGIYSATLTATNAGGSDVETKTNIINVLASPSLSINTTGATCNGVNNGTASVVATGGGGAYTYAWTGVNSNTASAINLAPGAYAVTVTDVNGCASNATANVTSSVNINVQLNVTDSSALGGESSIFTNVNGGTPPYTYVWDNGATSASLTNLAPSWYEVVVTDANGCLGIAGTSIGNVSIQNPEWLTYISLYPNPATSELYIDMALQQREDVQYEIYSAIGQVIYRKHLDNFSSGVEKVNLSDFSEGVYFVRISDNTNTKIVRFIKK